MNAFMDISGVFSGRTIQESLYDEAFMPGPEKPKCMDLFLFPSFHHIAAVKNEGLVIWNSLDSNWDFHLVENCRWVRECLSYMSHRLPWHNYLPLIL